MSKIVRILIADDHPIVRKGLKALLEHQGHIKVIAEAETGEEAIQKAQETLPDIAVLDIRMPGLSGIEACRQIVNTVNGCKVIMLTANTEDALLMAAIQAGAAGYVLKLASDNELLHMIEHISSGEGSLDPLAIATAFKALNKAAEAHQGSKLSSLSAQEIAVLSLVTKGLTNRQIANKLYLGEGTVRNYVSSVLSKLSVTNRAEAAAFGAKHNINSLVPIE